MPARLPCRSVNGSQAQVASRIHGTYALGSDLLASCVKIRENSVLDTRAQVQDGLPVRLDGFWPSGALDSGEVRPAVGVGLKRGTKLWIGRLGCKRLHCLFLLGVEGMPDRDLPVRGVLRGVGQQVEEGGHCRVIRVRLCHGEGVDALAYRRVVVCCADSGGRGRPIRRCGRRRARAGARRGGQGCSENDGQARAHVGFPKDRHRRPADFSRVPAWLPSAGCRPPSVAADGCPERRTPDEPSAARNAAVKTLRPLNLRPVPVISSAGAAPPAGFAAQQDRPADDAHRPGAAPSLRQMSNTCRVRQAGAWC
jgi:hypothetical protein